MTQTTHFDNYSDNYDSALAESLSATGEDKDFFARGRVSWLLRCLKEIKAQPSTVVDYGCGIGSTTPHLLELLKADSVLGMDVSSKSLELAQRQWGSAQISFASISQFQPNGEIDLAYTSCVFHHIAEAERPAALDLVHRTLRPGGLFAFWENNPWNPGTRYAMSRCEFDKDAITLSAPKARGLLKEAGLEIIRTDFLFIFPRALRWLRGIEPVVSGMPLGGQYQVLCRKPF